MSSILPQNKKGSERLVHCLWTNSYFFFLEPSGFGLHSAWSSLKGWGVFRQLKEILLELIHYFFEVFLVDFIDGRSNGGLFVFLLEMEDLSENLASLNFIQFFSFFYFSQSRMWKHYENDELWKHNVCLIWKQTPPAFYVPKSMRTKLEAKIFRTVYI